MKLARILFGLAACTPLVVCEVGAREPTIEWLGSYAEAKRLARMTGKPMLVRFR